MSGRKKSGKPPRILERMLAGLHAYLPLEPLGDFEEDYKKARRKKGKFRADTWYFLQVMIALGSHFTTALIWSLVMLKNYFKIVLRQFKKQKINSGVNILGFSIGFAFCILVLLYAADELSYDMFHENSNSIYSVVSTIKIRWEKPWPLLWEDRKKI